MSNHIELCGMVTCRYRGPVYPIVYLSSQSLSAQKTCLTASRRWGGRGEPTVRLGGKISKSIISRPNRRECLQTEAIDHVWWPCHEHRHMFSDSLFVWRTWYWQYRRVARCDDGLRSSAFDGKHRTHAAPNSAHSQTRSFL